GALIVPQGWLAQRSGAQVPQWAADPAARKEIEARAMAAVMDAERALGFDPQNVSDQNLGWDITSRVGKGDVRFIEVKGRVADARTITVTKNEILSALNQPERWFLAIVRVHGATAEPRYVRRPFDQEPGFGVTSINY